MQLPDLRVKFYVRKIYVQKWRASCLAEQQVPSFRGPHDLPDPPSLVQSNSTLLTSA